MDLPDSKEVGKTGNWVSNSEGRARVPGGLAVRVEERGLGHWESSGVNR